MHEKKIARINRREMFGALAIYSVMLVASIMFARPMAAGALRTALLASPMLGFFLGIWAIARQTRRSDEFIRQSTLENLAIAAAVTAGLSFTYGFLETAGYPRLSMFAVWPVMGAAWAFMTLVRCRMNRG
jgi:hypothetical protein